MNKLGRYDHLSREDLIALIERRDAQRRYGLVWEREGIEPDRALNDDFVALDVDPDLSTAPSDQRGWRNLVIEGDNWDALRALRLTHTGRVKCILIDPPYNTGARDFTYNDRYVGAQDRYRQSLWLEFLYRRLLLARDLLADDGAILVCINDENRARLDLLMEQALPGMRLGSFVWRTKDTNNSDKRRNWSGVHEHILIYANSGFGFIGPDAGAGKFTIRPEFGETPVRLDPVTQPKTYLERPNSYYPIYNPETDLWYPCAPNQGWRFWSESRLPKSKARVETSMESLIRDGLIHFPIEDEPPFCYQDRAALDAAIAAGDVPRDGKGRPLLRADLPDLDFWVGKPIARKRISRIVRKGPEHDNATRPVGSWIAGLSEDAQADDVQILRSDRQGVATTEIEALFGTKAFTFPKPLSLIRNLIRACAGDGDTVLDFFAGSGTTGHAVLALNAADEADRRFILVSNTEATPDAPERNLCRDICAVRLRKAMGESAEDALSGDFAYLRIRRVRWDDVLYDLDPAAIWNLLQLRHDRPLRAFDPAAAVQIAEPEPDSPEAPALAYVTEVTDEAVATLRSLVDRGPLVCVASVPGLLRDRLDNEAVPVGQVPDRLLDEFPRVVAGL